MSGLEISADLAPLPLDAVTRAIALLGVRGSGKTFCAAVITEEIVDAGVPVVVLDPVGVWWGLKSSADGKSAGLPFVIFGGDHQDVALDEHQGELVADVILGERLSAVLDLSQMRKGVSKRFAQDFLERLYHRSRTSMHLVVDEADHFAPQRPAPGEQRLLGAMEDVVRRGRARGIGVSLATQRPQALHKDVLTQCEILVALRVSHPRDVEAINAWVEMHATEQQSEDVVAALPSLPTGTAFVWWPERELLKKVRIRRRRTFDSSATPKPGETRIEPSARAAIDLDAIRKALAPVDAVTKGGKGALETVAGPTEAVRLLENRVIELEAELTERQAPRLPDEAAEAVRGMTTAIGRLREAITVATMCADTLARGIEMIGQSDTAIYSGRGVLVSTMPAPEPGQPTRTVTIEPERRGTMPSGPSTVGVGEARVLVALSGFNRPLRRGELATLSEFSNSGGFRNVLSTLATHNPPLIEKPDADRITLTQAGMKAIGHAARPRTTEQLIEAWNAKLGGAAQRMLGCLVRAYPTAVTRGALATGIGMDGPHGGFRNVLSEVSRAGLLVKEGGNVKASPALFLGARR